MPFFNVCIIVSIFNLSVYLRYQVLLGWCWFLRSFYLLMVQHFEIFPSGWPLWTLRFTLRGCAAKFFVRQSVSACGSFIWLSKINIYLKKCFASQSFERQNYDLHHALISCIWLFATIHYSCSPFRWPIIIWTGRAGFKILCKTATPTTGKPPYKTLYYVHPNSTQSTKKLDKPLCWTF